MQYVYNYTYIYIHRIICLEQRKLTGGVCNTHCLLLKSYIRTQIIYIHIHDIYMDIHTHIYEYIYL